MKKKIISTIFYFLIFLSSTAQDIQINELSKKWELKLSKELLDFNNPDKVKAYYKNSLKSNNNVLELSTGIGDYLQSKSQYKNAIEYYKEALNCNIKNIKAELYVKYKLLTCYNNLNDYNNALETANAILENHLHYKHDILLVKTLVCMGGIYINQGDAAKAMIHYEKALTITRKVDYKKSIIQALVYREMGRAYELIGLFDKALYVKNKAIKILINKEGKRSINLADYYQSLALTYQKIGQYNKAIEIHEKSLNLGIKLLQGKKKDLLIIDVYDRLGMSYYFLGNYEKSLNNYLFSIRKSLLIKTISTQAISERYTKASACYTHLSRFFEAAVLIDSALAYAGFNEKKTLPFEKIMVSKPSLLITLYFKAKNSLHLYLKTGCEEDLERAHEEYDLCIKLIDNIISSFDDSDSKQYLVDRFYYIFESIIEVNYQFYQLRGERKYVDRAMRYMEKSRSILLKEMMQQSKATILAGIPDTLLGRERRLREQIATLENRRYESGRKLLATQQQDPAFHPLNDSLFTLREQYWALLKEMEQRYPEYYALKHADHSAETSAIVNRLLQPQEALVQYFVGDDHIYTLVYRGDGAYTMTKAPVGDLDRKIKDLRESIYAYVLTPSDSLVRAYADGAHQLYQKLLQPISGYLSYRVTIIPDGLLEYLPFEALLTEKANPNSNFRAWPYCLRKYSFGYAHSVLSLEEMRQRQNRPKYRKVLAIAPSFSPGLAVRSAEERRRSFGPLEDNLAEVAGIRDLFPAKTLVGAEATVESFKALAGDYAVLHLATHAKADNEDGEYAYVAFSETKDTAYSNLLYLKSLYTLSLHADMVVLSACETGVGKLRRGEGVVSLARGFSHAGANSLVTTLWRISDHESATLMQRYYRGLKNDLPKDEALRQAKINYLNEASGNSAHPFFWAAFVTIGDMEPLDLPDWGWIWWLLGLVLIPIGYWVWKKGQRAWGKLAEGE